MEAVAVKAKRRSAGPSRASLAANDDVPSIGGLIFALHQKPSKQPLKVAAIASAVWGGGWIVARLGHAGTGVRASADLARDADAANGDRAYCGYRAADCTFLAPGDACLARAGAEIDVLGDDRGGHPAGRAGSHG